MKYTKRRTDKIFQMLSTDDYTIDEVCRATGITFETFSQWRKTKPEFSELLLKAEELRLGVFKKAARSGLLTLLQGKEFTEESTEFVSDKEGKPRIKSKKTTKKVILPNPTSVIFALKNLDPDAFADVFRSELTGKNGAPIQSEIVEPPIDYSKLSEAALLEIAAARTKKRM